jgi:nucleoside-diphosphate-sugar epimerase
MNILVTGNLGYNGPILVKELMDKGHYVVGLDTGYFMENALYSYIGFLPNAQIFSDLRTVEKEDIQKHNIEAVVHLAGISNDPMGELAPEITMKINSEGTKKLVKLCKELGIKHFTYASSCSIYGIQKEGQKADEKVPLRPLTAYAKSKAESEEHLNSNQDENFKVAIMRYPTMFGSAPILRLDVVVNNLCGYAYINNEVKILSDGTPWRPLIHVKDFANITSKMPDENISGTFNVGFTNMNYQVKDIGEHVSKISKAPLSINKEKTPDERSYQVDFSKIEQIVGDTAEYGLDKGIEQLLEDYKKYKMDREDFEEGRFIRLKALKKKIEDKRICKELFVRR